VESDGVGVLPTEGRHLLFLMGWHLHVYYLFFALLLLDRLELVLFFSWLGENGSQGAGSLGLNLFLHILVLLLVLGQSLSHTFHFLKFTFTKFFDMRYFIC